MRSERKIFEFIAPNNFTVLQKRLIIRSITENQNREIGEELWRKLFKNFMQQPPGKNMQAAQRTQDRKNIKKSCPIHNANVVTKWLSVELEQSLNRPASRIKSVNRTCQWSLLIHGNYKLTNMCGLKRRSSNTITYLTLTWTTGRTNVVTFTG